MRKATSNLVSPKNINVASGIFAMPAILSSSSQESLSHRNPNRSKLGSTQNSGYFSKEPINIVSFTGTPDKNEHKKKSIRGKLMRQKARNKMSTDAYTDEELEIGHTMRIPSNRLTLSDLHKRFEVYQRNQRTQFSPRGSSPRTAWFSAVTSTRREMIAADYSIIAGLRAENKLLGEELKQLKLMNRKLLTKLDNFEK